MDNISANSFFEQHVKARWPDWQPSGVEISDWLFWIGRVDENTALQSIREHRGQSNWKRPVLAKFRALVRLKSPAVEKVEQPEPTAFVMYEGGGRGTLLAGYFFPIIVPPNKVDKTMRIAENVRQYYENRNGGLWKVYAETSNSAMAKMRHGYYEGRANTKGKGKKENIKSGKCGDY